MKVETINGSDPHKIRDATFEPLDEKWFVQAGVKPEDRKHLLNSMSSLERGRAPTPSFKLYGKTDWSVVTDFFHSIEGKVVIPNWMKDYEMSRESKFGSQGGFKSWEVLGPLFKLYQERYGDVNLTEIEKSNPGFMKRFINQYSFGPSLQMASARDTLSMLIADEKIEDRAAGCPDFSLKKTDPIAQEHAVQAALLDLWVMYFGYTFSRFNKQKPRIFMPMPFSTMVSQARWYQVFLKRIQELTCCNSISDPTTLFWSDKIGFWNQLRIFNGRLKFLEDTGSDFSKGVFIFNQRDFEKMDTTEGPSQIKDIFVPCVARAFHYTPGSQPYKYLEKCMMSIVNIPIASPSGMMVGDHGTASGGEITNGGETTGNHAYDQYATELLNKANRQLSNPIPFTIVYSVGNGDDGATLYHLEDESRLEEFKELRAKCYSKSASDFHYIAQPAKDLFSTEYGLYCQNMYWIDSTPPDYPVTKRPERAAIIDSMINDNTVSKGQHYFIHMAYPASLILNSIMNPEKEYSKSQWDKDYRDIDIAGKLNNGVGLPYFHELIDYVDNGLKYPLLGATEPETARILSKYDKYRSLQSKSERYNRDEFDFKTSPVVKYILNKRYGKESI